jgi:hypothetical protein
MSDQRRRPKVARGRDQKKRKYYLLQVEQPTTGSPDGVWFRMKRIDFLSIVMEGALPAPLLNAVDRIQDIRKKLAGEGEGGLISAIDSLTRENQAEFQELKRRIAVKATLEPKLTHSKAASLRDDDLMWVGGKSDVPGEEHLPEQADGDVPAPQMMVIWKAVMGEAGLVTMSDDDAESFRASEQGNDAPVVRDGDEVRTEAVELDRNQDGGGEPRGLGPRTLEEALALVDSLPSDRPIERVGTSS